MVSIAGSIRNPSRIFYGWRMLAIISVISAINGGFYSKGAALFLLPVESSLGLSRASTSLIFSLAKSAGAVQGPLLGLMVDRFGSQKMLLIGTVLTGVGFLLFARAATFWAFGVAYLGFISLGVATAFSLSTSAMVNNCTGTGCGHWPSNRPAAASAPPSSCRSWAWSSPPTAGRRPRW